VGLFTGRDSRKVAVVITTDGRRVHVPVDDPNALDVSAAIHSLALFLIGLIRSPRRASGGPR
jgi:hypothetical protein